MCVCVCVCSLRGDEDFITTEHIEGLLKRCVCYVNCTLRFAVKVLRCKDTVLTLKVCVCVGVSLCVQCVCLCICMCLYIYIYMCVYVYDV